MMPAKSRRRDRDSAAVVRTPSQRALTKIGVATFDWLKIERSKV